MSIEEDKKVLTDKSFKSERAQRPTKTKVYADYLADKGVYENRCEIIFNAWKDDHDDDKATRRKYASWITFFVLLQVVAVYVVIVVHLRGNSDATTAQVVEFLGVVGAILAQSFGVFYLVVKYFFGKRPEDLEKISSFFLNCHPSRFGSGYRNKREK